MPALGSAEIAGLGFEQVVRDAPVAIVVVDTSGSVIFSNGRAREVTARQLGREMPAHLDRAIDIFHPDGRRYERRESPVVRSLTSGEEIVDEEFFYALPGGGRLWMRCSSSPVRDRDGHIVAAVVAQTDISERKREEARRACERKRDEAERERWAHQQALVADLGLRALGGEDVRALMDEAVALVARTLDVELAGVAELPAGGDEVVVRAGVGWLAGVVGRRLEHGRESQAGYTLLRREPVVSEDQATDPRFAQSAVGRENGVVSALSVMIESPEEPFGVLAALSTRRRAFSKADVSFVQSVANVLAGAVERTRAQQRLDEIRQAERSRIARDLHDEALQDLTDALAQATVHRAAGLAPAAVEQLIATLKRVGLQLRAAIHDLRVTAGEQPFPEALGALVDAQRAAAVDCRIDLEIAREPPIDVRGERATEVLRIAREALTNARRHSGARRVRVTAGRGAGQRGVSLEVADDGRGFDLGEVARRDGRGLQGMRERAALLGGALDIRSSPGAGTVVHVELGPG